MKKLIISLFALSIAASAFSQTELKPAIGFNITNVSKDPANGKYQGQAGWQFGGTVLFGKKFYIEPGLLFVKKSTKFVEEGQSNVEFDTDLNGLRIPLAVGYHLLGREESTAALRIFGGGSSFIVTGVNNENYEKEDFESPTWGVFAGAGLDIWILFLDLQYEWSLTNVTKIDQFDLGQTRSFFANAGIRIKL